MFMIYHWDMAEIHIPILSDSWNGSMGLPGARTASLEVPRWAVVYLWDTRPGQL